MSRFFPNKNEKVAFNLIKMNTDVLEVLKHDYWLFYSMEHLMMRNNA